MSVEAAQATAEWLRRVVHEELLVAWERATAMARAQQELSRAGRGFVHTNPVHVTEWTLVQQVLGRRTEKDCPEEFRRFRENAAASRVHRQLNWMCQYGLVETVGEFKETVGYRRFRPVNLLEKLAKAANEA